MAETNEKQTNAADEDAAMERTYETMRKLLGGQQTLAMTQGITRDELEAAYKLGSTFYTSGRFDDAEKFFRFLVLMDHTNAKYHLALGSVRQVNKDYQKALESYALSALCDVSNPKAHYYAAECALELGELDAAESAVVTLLAKCPAGNQRNDEYRAQAEALKQRIGVAREKLAKAQ